MGTVPIWWRDAGLPRWEAPRETRREDVVVVGAGLAGLGLARALRERGLDPLVVDAVGPAGGASGRNAGFVLRTHVTEYPALRGRVGPTLAQALLATAADNAARVARIAATSGAYRPTGSLMLAAGDDEGRALGEAREALRGDGVRVSEALVPRALAGFDAALRIEDDGEVHPGRVVAALAEGVRGARLRVTSVGEGFLEGEAGVALEAETVVLATNAWTPALVPELASVITPQRAQMLATEPLPAMLDVPCYAGLGFDYFRQRADGRVLLGGRRHVFRAAEQTGHDATSDEVQGALEAYLATHLPFARGAHIEDRWSGTMAFSADGLPLAGPLPGRPRTWVLGAWTGHGLGLSLAVADRLAEALTSRRASGDPLLSALDPARFSAMVARG